MTTHLDKSHLKFYQQHQIAPVRYDLNDMEAHLQRRLSLYLKLGLPPLAFRGASILEVAAGTGHNSLYLAQSLPKRLVLLEPNEVGVDYIRAVYGSFQIPHTTPEIITSMLEDYSPTSDFDIVLCENWLGNSRHELSLLDKLSRMVAPHGVLIVTTVSPIGFVPNLLRRFLGIYAAPLQETFKQRTNLLVETFASHLDTLKAMTRNKTDWVQDNMINPAYFGLCLSMPKVIEQLGERFEVMGASPSIAEDWRWFKGLNRTERQLNQHFLNEYWAKAHNFLDHREPVTVRDPDLNRQLEQKAIELLRVIENHEDVHSHGGDIQECVDRVVDALDGFLAFVPSHLHAAIRGLREIRELIGSQHLNVSLSHLEDFPGLFGRETAYLSLYQSRKIYV